LRELARTGILIGRSSLNLFHVGFEDFDNGELTDSFSAFGFSESFPVTRVNLNRKIRFSRC
jgi:hypothetical protein